MSLALGWHHYQCRLSDRFAFPFLQSGSTWSGNASGFGWSKVLSHPIKGENGKQEIRVHVAFGAIRRGSDRCPLVISKPLAFGGHLKFMSPRDAATSRAGETGSRQNLASAPLPPLLRAPFSPRPPLSAHPRPSRVFLCFLWSEEQLTLRIESTH